MTTGPLWAVLRCVPRAPRDSDTEEHRLDKPTSVMSPAEKQNPLTLVAGSGNTPDCLGNIMATPCQMQVQAAKVCFNALGSTMG